MSAEAIIDVELGPVRVVGQRKVAEPPRARNWSQVQAMAARPPSVLANHARNIRAEYDAGRIKRITRQWVTSTLNANRALRFDLANMRARSRDLERNDPWAKKFLELVETNVVGAAGVTFQSRAFDLGPAPDYKPVPDKAANTIIEREYAKFSRLGQYDVTGRLSRQMAERLMIRTIARDGEVLVKRVADPESRWGIRYQILEADWLDEKLEVEQLPNGNRIIMGVEVSPAGRAVAWHLHEFHPGDSKRGRTGGHVRYTAEQIGHYFIAQRPEQVRGVPWMHAAMSNLYQLGEFNESAILSARLGADKFMLLEDPEGTAASLADPADPNAPAASGALSYSSEKGSIDILPSGVKVANWDPKYPSDAYAPFILAALRGVSSGLGVSYESLSNDRNGVTWTSIRHAVLDDRDRWKTLQAWFIDTAARDSYEFWLRSSLVAPAVPLAFLPAGKLDKFIANPFFSGRRWDWVNPKDDIEAKVSALKARLTSHRRVLAEQGIDLEDLLGEIQADDELAAAYGIDLDAAVGSVVPPPPAPAPATNDAGMPADQTGATA